MMNQTVKSFKPLLVNITLFCAVLFLSLAVIDTALFFFTQTRFNWHKVQVTTEDDAGFLYYMQTPQQDFAPKNRFNYFISNEELKQIPNSIYVPLNALPRRKGFYPERTKQAAIIGDSFTIGEGVGNKETLGWFLGQEYPDYNFVNYGKSGIGTASVCGRIKQQILPQETKIRDIIYFHNINDVVHEWPKEAWTDFANIFHRNAPFRGLLRHSTILNLLLRANTMHNETRRTVRLYMDMYFGQDNKINVERMFDAITQTDKELKSNGVNFHVVLYPMLHKDLFGRYPLAPIHDMVKTRLSRDGVSCLDATDAFRDIYFMSRMRVNSADYHPNGKANELVARFVRKSIRLE